jgi:hypothetical protein
MNIEKTISEKVIGGSGTSILRAAAKQILESLEKHEAVEGEEASMETAIGDLAKQGQMDRSLVSAMLIHSVAESYVQSKMQQARQLNGMDVSQMQKVGNC